MWLGLERRTVRSLGAGDAMTHALDWAVSRSDLDGALIADDDGFLVSANRGDLDLEAVAAILPILARGDSSMQIRRSGIVRGLTVTSFQLGDETIHVGLLGGTAAARRTEVPRICAATRRILGN
jgi:hypothetical protein